MQVLPFYVHTALISLNHPYFANTRHPAMFRVATMSNELLPFVMKLPADFNGNFQLQIRAFHGDKLVAKFGPGQFNHRILKSGNDRFLVYDGGPIGCIDLDPCQPYYLSILDQVSEVFYAIRESDGHIKFELSNVRNVLGLPYSSVFKQWFYCAGELYAPKFEPFTKLTRDDQGFAQVSYARLTKNYEFNFQSVSESMQAVFCSMNMLDTVTVSDELRTIKLDGRLSKVAVNDLQAWYGNVTLTLPDSIQYDTKPCPELTFKEDATFTGTKGVVACAEPSLVENLIANCESLFSLVSVKCDPYDTATFTVKVLTR